jgi:hypothetical protein
MTKSQEKLLIAGLCGLAMVAAGAVVVQPKAQADASFVAPLQTTAMPAQTSMATLVLDAKLLGISRS